MPDLEQSIQQVLDFLSVLPRDDSGFAWTMGDPIAAATGLPAAEINEAVTLLVQSGARSVSEVVRWFAPSRLLQPERGHYCTFVQ
jgi:hypothetical protein